MNGLDSPLEALTFIPVNLGTVISTAANNLWAWFAVIAATLSLWRLRTTTTKTTSSLISLSPPPPPPTTPTPTPPPTKSNSSPTKTTSFKLTDIDENHTQKQEEEEVLTRGNSKKFFTVYFEEREEEEQNHDDEDDEMMIMNGGDEMDEKESMVMMINKRWGSLRESTVEMRGEDFGWYSYQNRKVINGSVVRLWEEERESGFCGSPRRCRTAAAVAIRVLA